MNDHLKAGISCSILRHMTIRLLDAWYLSKLRAANFGIGLELLELPVQRTPTCALPNVLQSQCQAYTFSELSARGLLSLVMLIKLQCGCLEQTCHADLQDLLMLYQPWQLQEKLPSQQPSYTCFSVAYQTC